MLRWCGWIIGTAFLMASLWFFLKPARLEPLRPPPEPDDPAQISDVRERMGAVYSLLTSGRTVEAYDWLKKALEWDAPAPLMAMYLLALRDMAYRGEDIYVARNAAFDMLSRLAQKLEEAPENQRNYMKNFLNTTRYLPTSSLFDSVSLPNAAGDRSTPQQDAAIDRSTGQQDVVTDRSTPQQDAADNQGDSAHDKPAAHPEAGLELEIEIVRALDQVFFRAQAYGPGYGFIDAMRRDIPVLVDESLFEKYNIHMKTGMITQ